MELPTAYIPGYEKARAIDPETAANYIAHTTIGDPDADALMAELSALPARENIRSNPGGHGQRR